jgi:hypothetical protein
VRRLFHVVPHKELGRRSFRMMNASRWFYFE